VISRYATTIISIDQISDLPFHESGKSVVILNPFDMTQARQKRSDKTTIKQKWSIPPKKFVVSIIGRIEQAKGFDFFCRVVNASLKNENLTFLVAGKGSGPYGNTCVQFFKTHKNVTFVGELTDMSDVYAITDVVIRCEDYLPLGRTVWEGLFSGCICLIPVNSKDNVSAIQEYLGKYMISYRALDVSDCLEKLDRIIQENPDTVKDSGYSLSDNMSASAKKFLSILLP
jgi:glycogen synthase